MNEKQKILVCGDVEGKFKNLFTRVDNISKKSGPFEMLLCVGNFFGVNNVEFEDYKSGIRKVNVPTYILGPNKQEHIDLYPNKESELCPNVNFLGKRGIFSSSGGLKIAYLSGIFTNESSTKYQFNKQDVTALRDTCIRGQSNYRSVDILLTGPWPKNVTNLDQSFKGDVVTSGSEMISWLAAELKPRYHISGLEGQYYERAPYRNYGTHGDIKSEIATRFLALARVGNPEKQKWIYALNLTPVEKMRLTELCQQTVDETECPYTIEMLLKASGKPTESVQFFYNMNVSDDKRRNSDRETGQRKRQKPVFDQAKCWFCLASPEVEKHLVISVGNDVYLALAKGGLVDEHLLILPIEHHQCSLSLPEPAMEELKQFKSALIKFFVDKEKVPIFFERNFKTSHLQIQVVPVPKAAIKELADIFKDEAEASGIKLEELPHHNRLDQMVPNGAPYFCVELPDITLYTRCRSGFPLQFGREVLAAGPVLNISNRADWKDCSMPRSEEDSLVKRIRTSFEPFDFTI